MAQSKLTRDEKDELIKKVVVHFFNGTSEVDNSNFYANPGQIEDLIKIFTIETGAPAVINICLTSTPKIKETKDNQICNFSYPIIPPVFDLNIENENGSEEFISAPQEDIIQRIQSTNPRQLAQIVKNYANMISSTIVYDLALRYVEAKQKAENASLPRPVRTKEHKIMNQLANLQIFKTLKFDLDLFEKCAGLPEIIPDKKGSYTFRYPNGKTAPATYKEFQASGRYIRGLDQYRTDKALFNMFLEYIKKYKTYEIDKIEQNTQPGN